MEPGNPSERSFVFGEDGDVLDGRGGGTAAMLLRLWASLPPLTGPITVTLLHEAPYEQFIDDFGRKEPNLEVVGREREEEEDIVDMPVAEMDLFLD